MVRYSTPELQPALMVCRSTSPRGRHYHKTSICAVGLNPAYKLTLLSFVVLFKRLPIMVLKHSTPAPSVSPRVQTPYTPNTPSREHDKDHSRV